MNDLNQIPQVLHLYWGGNPLSYLQALTPISFLKFNHGWAVNVWTPKITHIENMGEVENKYTGKCYLRELQENPSITFKEFDFDQLDLPVGLFDRQYTSCTKIKITAEVFKSDLFRYYILATEGGFWSDFDILYLDSLQQLDYNEANTVYCLGGHGAYFHSIGLLGGSASNEFFRFVYEKAKGILAESNFDEPQMIGTELLTKEFPTEESITERFPNSRSYNFPHLKLYPFSCSDYDVHDMFNPLGQYRELELPEGTVGLHWFAGNSMAKHFLNERGEAVVRDSSFVGNLLRTRILG